MAMLKHCFLVFLSVVSISYLVAAAYTPPTSGSWQQVPDARTSPVFIDKANFSVGEYNKNATNPLVFQRVLEGQIWVTRALGVTNRRFLLEATTNTNLYKVYEAVVSQVVYPNAPNILQSFEAVLA